MPLTRDPAGRPPRPARQRRILSRIVRETEAPTDSLPLLRPHRKAPDDFYDARVGAADDAYYADPRVEPAWSNRAKLDNERSAALADLARQHNEMLAKLWFEGIADSLGGEEREG